MTNELLSDRSQQLLKALIELYIRDGQPVGSKTLVAETGLCLSPATIRNVMADLEERGLIVSPHTSAGRMPTAQGYRFFVDTLLTVRALEADSIEPLRERLTAGRSSKVLVQSASELLSTITRQAGVVMLPRRDFSQLQQVEFLPLSGQRVLVILVMNDREVQNRIIHVSREFSREELSRAANFINLNFTGLGLAEVSQRVAQALHDERLHFDGLMQQVLAAAQTAFVDETLTEDLVIAGQSHLLEQADPQQLAQLRTLFDAISRKRDVLDLLERAIDAQGVQIYIGGESGFSVFDDFSVITAPYQSGGQTVGVLGVIGPTRMAYETVIPMVDVTARLLSFALDQQ
jgi:heat-inducible transcriptional repressor